MTSAKKKKKKKKDDDEEEELKEKLMRSCNCSDKTCSFNKGTCDLMVHRFLGFPKTPRKDVLTLSMCFPFSPLRHTSMLFGVCAPSR